MKKQTTKITLITLTILNFILSYTKAQENTISITPALSDDEIEHTNRWINFLWTKWWKFWGNYILASKDLSFNERLLSWILTRDDIPFLLTLFVHFLSQLWLAVWMIFIMYAWYKYIFSVFNGWQVPRNSIKNAIIWVIIIIFSYAIMRILTSMVWFT